MTSTPTALAGVLAAALLGPAALSQPSSPLYNTVKQKLAQERLRVSSHQPKELRRFPHFPPQ